LGCRHVAGPGLHVGQPEEQLASRPAAGAGVPFGQAESEPVQARRFLEGKQSGGPVSGPARVADRFVGGHQRAALAIAEQIQAPYRLGSSYSLVGQLQLRRGNTQAAARLLRQALRQFQRIADPLMTANCLFGLALVASAENHHTLAANLLGAAAARYDASGTRLLAALGREHQAIVSTTRAALGGDRFDAEHHRGATMPPAQALALALGEPTPG